MDLARSGSSDACEPANPQQSLPSGLQPGGVQLASAALGLLLSGSLILSRFSANKAVLGVRKEAMYRLLKPVWVFCFLREGLKL